MLLAIILLSQNPTYHSETITLHTCTRFRVREVGISSNYLNIPPGSTDDLSLVFSLALAKAALPLFVPPISLPGPIPVWLQRPYKGTGFTVDKIRTR